MVEVAQGPERRFSPEQQRLIDAARELLTLPEVVTNGPYYESRSATWGEKLKRIVGRARRLRVSIAPSTEVPLERVFITHERFIKTLALRSLRREDGSQGSWGGGVYLEQHLVKDLDFGTTAEESLTLRAVAVVDNEYAFTQLSALKQQPLWFVHLLEPIDDVNEVTRLQSEINEAVKRYSSPES